MSLGLGDDTAEMETRGFIDTAETSFDLVVWISAEMMGDEG
jgi:hypothetical protein